MLATHDYNNIITCIWSIWNDTKKNNNKKSATASAKYEVQQDNNVHSEQSELCALSETLLPMH